MQVDSPEKIRNLAVAGHNDTGKTTLVSALLYAGNVVNRLGRVEDGNGVLRDDRMYQLVRQHDVVGAELAATLAFALMFENVLMPLDWACNENICRQSRES